MPALAVLLSGCIGYTPQTFRQWLLQTALVLHDVPQQKPKETTDLMREIFVNKLEEKDVAVEKVFETRQLSNKIKKVDVKNLCVKISDCEIYKILDQLSWAFDSYYKELRKKMRSVPLKQTGQAGAWMEKK